MSHWAVATRGWLPRTSMAHRPAAPGARIREGKSKPGAPKVNEGGEQLKQKLQGERG